MEGRKRNQKGYPREGTAGLDLPGKAEKSARQMRSRRKSRSKAQEQSLKKKKGIKGLEGVGKATLNERRRRTVTKLAS